MSQGKKFTQTTLPFFIKSKSTEAPVKASSPSAPTASKKRPKPTQELKHDLEKKAKLTLPKPAANASKPAVDGHTSEPEVTSSSEPVQPPPSTTSQKATCTLEPFITLTRCDTPTTIEVTSSTGADGVIDIFDVDPPEAKADNVSICLANDNAEPATIIQSDDRLSGLKEVDNKNASHTEEPSTEPADTLASPKGNAAGTTKTPRSVNRCTSLSAKKRQEEQRQKREQEKEQKRLKKLEEKQRKEKEAEEAKRIKAEEREAERLVKLKEKEEKQRFKEEQQAQRQAEIDAKNAQKELERQKKEEVRLKKEEEKRQKEMEKNREKEEKQRAIEAQQNVLKKFFQKSAKKETRDELQETKAATNRFKPFCPNSDMRLAVRHRVPPIEKGQFDKTFADQSLAQHCFFSELKSNGARTSPSTWPADDDVCLISTEVIHRAKFLQFHTDVRPAYFGTWRKKSKYIRARRPFGEDKERFDYENDSADEWEEEEPGESVDSGDEEEEKDEFDFDPELREDGFLVDHNYLSDGEGGASDDEETLAAKKTKQMIARTYGKRNRKKNKLKPMVYGTVWQHEEGSAHPHGHKLLAFSAIVFQPQPIEFTAPVKESPTIVETGSAVKKCRQVPEEAYPDLIRAIHGCTKGIKVIVEQFRKSWEEKSSIILSKAPLKATIQSIASYQKLSYRGGWLVNDELLVKYNLVDLPVPNPAYISKTPAKRPLTPLQKVTPTPPESTSTQKTQSDSMQKQQKRMTEFLQPSKKKLKVDSSETSGASSPDVQFTALSNSPEVVITAQRQTSARKVALITLSDSPECSAKDPVKPERCTPGASPKRIAFTTLAPNTTTPSTKTNAQPRRVVLTPVSSGAVSKVISPRRVALTTISTPPKTHQVSIQEKVTPTSSPQTNKSPRRVKLTTLSQPLSSNQPTNLLTERSQNTPKIDTDSMQIKGNIA